MSLPDAPWIRDAESRGYVSDLPEVNCPVCGQSCATIYIDQKNEPCGCENCISTRTSMDWLEETLEEMRPG